MSEPLAPDLEARAQDLAARLRTRSADALLDMARRLVASTDETLFGDTEFALRHSALGLVADAYACHLPQKSGYTTSATDRPTCGRRAPFHLYRAKAVETLGGGVTGSRAYYHSGSSGTPPCVGRWPTASRRGRNCCTRRPAFGWASRPCGGPLKR